MLGIKLSHPKKMKRSSIRLILLPFAALVFSIGWFFYVLGDKNERSKIKRSTKSENVHLMPIIYEDKETIKSQ